MPATSRLSEFRATIDSAQTIPPSSQGSSAASSRPTTPLVSNADRGKRGWRSTFQAKESKRKPLTEEEQKQHKEEVEFLEEGKQIYKYLSQLARHIKIIRRAYLSTQPPALASRAPTPIGSPRPDEIGNGKTQDPEEQRLRVLERSKVLTDREREEVDLRSRVILQGCKERVKVLEVRDQMRQNRSKPSTTTSLLSTWLPSLASNPSDSAHMTPQQRSTILTAHHASIIWYLNNLLVKTSDSVRNMQEERSRIREERGKSLGGSLDRDIVGSGGSNVLGSVLTRRMGLGKRVGQDERPIRLTVPTASISKPSSASRASATASMGEEPQTHQDSNGNVTLSNEQMQQFASENDTLLSSLNSTLTSVLSAEKSLNEISQLQSSLVSHLAAQTETIEQLYDDAMGTVADLGKANEQLKKAKQRGKEGRLYLIVFLVIASLALLFVDWYSG